MVKTSQHTYTSAAGLRTDFEKLIQKFVDTNSVRYESFCEVWKACKMSFILRGRPEEKELREFVDECLKVAIQRLVSTNSFQIRVCSLYFLYAIYYLQPFLYKARICVTLKNWRTLLEFTKEAEEQSHLDVGYIFQKLVFHKAFHFTASDQPIHPHMNNDSGRNEEFVQTNFVLDKSILSEILEPDNIAQLSTLHEQYHLMKCSLASSKGRKDQRPSTSDKKSVPDPSLNVIQENLIQYITKTVTAHEEWRKQRSDPSKMRRKRRESGATTTTSESEADSDLEMIRPVSKRDKKEKTVSVGDRRAEIKARAFGSVPKSKKAGYTSSQSDQDPSWSPKKKYRKKATKAIKHTDSDSDEDNEFTGLQKHESSFTGRSSDSDFSPPRQKSRGKGRPRGQGQRSKVQESLESPLLDMIKKKKVPTATLR